MDFYDSHQLQLLACIEANSLAKSCYLEVKSESKATKIPLLHIKQLVHTLGKHCTVKFEPVTCSVSFYNGQCRVILLLFTKLSQVNLLLKGCVRLLMVHVAFLSVTKCLIGIMPIMMPVSHNKLE